MDYWIVPSNDNLFRIEDAISAQGNLVDWRSSSFSVGDVVFIYKVKPEQRISMKMVVEKINIKLKDSYVQEPYWTDKEAYSEGLGTFLYCRFKLIERYDSDVLSLKVLRHFGIKGNIQTRRHCPQALIDYIEKGFETFDLDYVINKQDFYEGATIKVTANKYERNISAREKCIQLKGLVCSVCGIDFEKVYGNIGKGFIHIHHLVPISNIGKEYKLDVYNDLVPVCPNCHCMLHQKNPPYTIEELKRKLKV